MDVIGALGAEIRKMFAGDVFLSLATLAMVSGLGALVRFGGLSRDLAPWLLMIGVAVVLVAAINIFMFKNIRKTSR